MCCVGNDDDLRSIVLGENGALAGMAAGSIFVDHTTASAEVARELFHAGKQKGVGFIDAPVRAARLGPSMAYLPSCAAAIQLISKPN